MWRFKGLDKNSNYGVSLVLLELVKLCLLISLGCLFFSEGKWIWGRRDARNWDEVKDGKLQLGCHVWEKKTVSHAHTSFLKKDENPSVVLMHSHSNFQWDSFCGRYGKANYKIYMLIVKSLLKWLLKRTHIIQFYDLL